MKPVNIRRDLILGLHNSVKFISLSHYFGMIPVHVLLAGIKYQILKGIVAWLIID